jgi:hypothetical protein
VHALILPAFRVICWLTQVVFELQRKLVWDFVQSTIVHSCDGGLYLRTQPQVDSGDWYALSGNLSVAEMHSIAYDWKVSSLLTLPCLTLIWMAYLAWGVGLWTDPLPWCL